MGLITEASLISVAQLYHNRWLYLSSERAPLVFLPGPRPYCLRIERDGRCYQSHSIYFGCFVAHLCPHFLNVGSAAVNLRAVCLPAGVWSLV